MNKSRVALVRCEDYDPERVYQAVKRGLDLLGGISQFAKQGEKIVLKPNVLVGTDPARSVTTHPAVLRAAGLLLRELGAEVSYGDSASIGGCEFNLKRAGLKTAGDELGLRIADFDHGQEVSHKTALLNKKFMIANGVLEADGLISLPKLKTHGLTRFTGAIKNQFGCIPGLYKREFHLKMPDPFDFATMLVDINTFIRPRLYIMDGIVAMEGNGPFAGKSRPLKVLLFSSDPAAVDAIACRLIGLNPEFVPTSLPAEKAGLGTFRYENIEMVGDDPLSFSVTDFKAVRKPPQRARKGLLGSFFKNRFTPRPAINPRKCVSCGTCLKMCPVGPAALHWGKNGKAGTPAYNYDHCIRCYCCQETCPEGAIDIKRPLGAKLLFRY